MNFTPKMESFCTFFFTPFLELNLLLENNNVFAENLMTTLFYVGPSVPKKFRDDFFDPNGTICAHRGDVSPKRDYL